jgi:hypothetical protein
MLLISKTGQARGVDPYIVSFWLRTGPAVMDFKEGSSDYWQSKMKSVVLCVVVSDGLVESDKFSLISPFSLEYWGVK